MLRSILLMIYRRLRANETYRDGVLKLLTNDSGGCSLLNKVIFKEPPHARDRDTLLNPPLPPRSISNRVAAKGDGSRYAFLCPLPKRNRPRTFLFSPGVRDALDRDQPPPPPRPRAEVIREARRGDAGPRCEAASASGSIAPRQRDTGHRISTSPGIRPNEREPRTD